MYRIPLDVVNMNKVPDWAIGISSFFKDRNPIGGLRVEAGHYDSIQKFVIQEEVTCVPLNQIFTKHSIRSLDLIHIDTEGYDYHVLKQIDFGLLQPSFVYYESVHLPVAEREAAISLLQENSYTCVEFGHETLASRAPLPG